MLSEDLLLIITIMLLFLLITLVVQTIIDYKEYIILKEKHVYKEVDNDIKIIDLRELD